MALKFRKISSGVTNWGENVVEASSREGQMKSVKIGKLFFGTSSLEHSSNCDLREENVEL